MDGFIGRNAAALEDFTRVSQTVGARADYVQGGGGNTSVKLDGKAMAIKASGYRLADIGPASAYAVLDWAALRAFYETREASGFADVEKAGADFAKASALPVQGLQALRPSVEAGFHSLLDRFAVHSHSVYANLAACCAQGREIAARALGGAPYAWGFVPYTDPGARLTFAIRDEMGKVSAEAEKRPAVILLQNHGLIAHHNDPGEALRIHSDANARIAREFGQEDGAFPRVGLRKLGEDLFESDTPFVRQCLLSGRYDEAFFLEKPLYPDQLVFLAGSFRLGEETDMPSPGSCIANTASGGIQYSMGELKARTIEETVAAVLFIAEAVRHAGQMLSSMGDAAMSFIAGWESEKYRKTISGT